MISEKDARQALKAASPVETLVTLERWLLQNQAAEDFENPQLHLHMRSGHVITGFLLKSSAEDEKTDLSFVLRLPLRTQTDDAMDIIYVNSGDIETVTVMNIDTILAALPPAGR